MSEREREREKAHNPLTHKVKYARSERACDSALYTFTRRHGARKEERASDERPGVGAAVVDDHWSGQAESGGKIDCD